MKGCCNILKDINDMYDELKRQGQLKASREEGKAEGRAEGVELANTAINMLKDGIAIDQICKETGLTEAQVAELQTLL